MTVLLGLASAVGFGIADFLGGYAAKRSPAVAVVAASQAWGLAVALVAVPLLGAAHMAGRDVALAACAGLLGAAGLLALYRGLALGRMGVVAPTSAVLVAVLPIAWGLAQGERPGPWASAGIVLALLAVVLVTRQPGGPGTDRQVLTSVARGAAAGVAFGTVFVLFAETGGRSEYGPILVTRVVSVAGLALGVLVARGPVWQRTARDATVAATGALDLAGNILFLAAVREGLTSLAAAVASLYPGVTVLLARGFLGESTSRVQVVGLGLALAGLALMGATAG
jgi:drug/metabolite transporter (DMT)-like permease